MAAARGRIEPAPRRVRGFLGHELVFDTTAARYVWEVPYYPQYYIPLADVRSEFLRDEGHPQKVQLGSSRLHSLTGAGQTHEKAAGCSTTAPSRARCASNGTGCAGSRRTSRSTAIPAIPTHVSTRCARTATSACSSTVSWSPTPSRRSCCSKPACRQGITSIRPTSPSSISNPVTPRRCVRTRARLGLLVGAGGRRAAPRSGLDVSLPATGRRRDRRPGRVLQREARRHRRRRRVGAPQTHFS